MKFCKSSALVGLFTISMILGSLGSGFLRIVNFFLSHLTSRFLIKNRNLTTVGFVSYKFRRLNYFSDLTKVFTLQVNLLTHFHQTGKNARANFIL